VQSFVGKFKDEFVAKGTAAEERQADSKTSNLRSNMEKLLITGP
jgi:hypothetical protein